MSWTTVYISGKTDFRDDVREKLERADMPLLPGYVESTREDQYCDLYWLDNGNRLKEFKEAIGAKLIWKHRIRFYTTLEEFLESQESKKNGFTPREQQMIEKMQMSSNPVL